MTLKIESKNYIRNSKTIFISVLLLASINSDIPFIAFSLWLWTQAEQTAKSSLSMMPHQQDDYTLLNKVPGLVLIHNQNNLGYWEL